jgi:ADP-ribosyl-[dinitrogen reductase] hydrolase
MIGGGPFDLRPGQWTDDTSMALCLAESLIECRGFDPLDQMRRYLKWYETGYMSSVGRCFDIGATVYAALMRFQQTGNPFAGPTDPHSAGNGCIMRLAPVPMFYCNNLVLAEHYSAESARTTHGAPECIDAARLFGRILVRALQGYSKTDVLLADSHSFHASPAIVALAQGSYTNKTENEIRGSGYVVQSLEAALWCFFQTASFRDAVLAAANLGDDADTTAAVCGQLAGAFYGWSSIPQSWREQLFMHEQICDLADTLYRLAMNHPDKMHTCG